MKLRALTNVRPTKDLGTQVILAPTEGQFKITPDAAHLLKVSDGQYCGVVYDDEGETGFVFKGSEDGLGAKLASTRKGGGGVLNFSAAAGWAELDGSTEHNTHYNVGETPVDAEELVDTPFDGMLLYPLTFVEKVEKQQRKSSSEDKSSDSASSNATAEAPAAEAVTADDFSDM